MKVYNKTVIDWLLEQQQFSLTLEWICYLQLRAQIRPWVKKISCPRTQSITVYYLNIKVIVSWYWVNFPKGFRAQNSNLYTQVVTNTGIRRIAMLVVYLDVKINNVMPSMDPVYMDAPVQMHYHPVAVRTVKSTK